MFFKRVLAIYLGCILYTYAFNVGILSSSKKSSFTKVYDTPYKDDELFETFQNSIFCNRELNGATIEAIGFDMDFTLAEYNEAFDLLAFNGAKQKLFSMCGYPSEVLKFEYNPQLFQRGLLIDKKRGNFLKLDRHKYVRKAFHGSTQLSKEERKSHYVSSVSQFIQFSESNFVNIDTLFLLIDAMLFSHMVDLKDNKNFNIQQSYEQIYKDIRMCVDQCHRDGVIKDSVIKSPEKYIKYDPGLVPMLKRFKISGKKLFLLTNSYWEYTNEVMKFLVYSSGENKDVKNWYDLFDLVIVGASKPSFLTEDFLSLFKVLPSGKLSNIEDKDSLQKLLDNKNGEQLFQGGHWQDLHKLLDVTSGERILYVGDHMYSDILRSKRSLGWRTCLVVPELELEIRISQMHKTQSEKIREFLQLQYDLDEYIDLLRNRYKLGITSVEQQLHEAEKKSIEIKSKVRRLEELYNLFFNENWGQLFKAGKQESRFARQVFDYACIYTSKATNLGKANPNRPFRPLQDYMPHDQVLYDFDLTDYGEYDNSLSGD